MGLKLSNFERKKARLSDTIKHMPLSINRNTHAHCPIDPLNEICEKFFQIWSHQAANIGNDLIEYTIRRMQSDRLRNLFHARNEFTHQEMARPICQIPLRIEDDLPRIQEHIRCFCLTTRNVYRHLRSDSRLYPDMCIDLDQKLIVKICRFIFKTKVLLEIFSKEQHLSDYQREQMKKHKDQPSEHIEDIHDPYRNITKAFIVLQSNFEILYGDILEKDFLQNVKTAVQTLPILLDTSKTIRLIFCALYKFSEPERQADEEAFRQRRSAYCSRKCLPTKQGVMNGNFPSRLQEHKKTETINQSQMANSSTAMPPSKESHHKSIKENSMKIPPTKHKSHPTVNKNQLSPSGAHATKQKQKPSPSHRKRKVGHKNKNASTIDSIQIDKHKEKSRSLNNNHTEETNSYPMDLQKIGWTTWLHNATHTLATILPSNSNPTSSRPLLTTWASLDRTTKP